MVIEFFENNFVGKEPNKALYCVMRDGILDIGTVLARFVIIEVCLQAIEDDEPYFAKLDYSTQKYITDCKQGVHSICKDLEAILDPIIQGLKD